MTFHGPYTQYDTLKNVFRISDTVEEGPVLEIEFYKLEVIKSKINARNEYLNFQHQNSVFNI